MSRSPSFFERYYILRGTNGFYSNFNISAKYSRNVLKVNLSNALKNLISENQCFAVNFFRENANDVERDGANFRLRPLDKIHFNDVVSVRELPLGKFDETTLSEIDKLTVAVDEKDIPLWRVILWELNVLDEQFITFYCDHALFDGNSGTFFHDLLLKELSKLDGEQLEYQDILFTNLEPSIPTPQLNERALALYNPPMLFVVSKIVEILFMPTVIKRSVARIWSWIYGKDYLNTFDYPKFQYKPCQKGDPTHFKLISFTPAEVTKMITNCKLHGLTLTPYLIAIGVQCLQQSVLKKVSNNAEYSSEVNISINNRRYLPEESANEVGLLISGVDLKIPPLNPNEPLVGVMKSVSSQLQDLVEQNHGSKIVGLLKYVKVLDFLKSKVGIHSRQTMELSNLGNKNFKHGSWEVENLFFSQSNGVASHFALSTVSTLKLGMNISFGYLEDYIEFPDEIANFVKTFKDKVINFDE